MTAARDDDFMALPGMEADSTATHHPEKRLSDDAAPASSKSALDALLDEYRARAKSEREKGTLFEELTRQFLLHDARFAHQFKEIYLWGEWPERRTGDTGIDLVAVPVDPSAGPVAVQCKFYALGHRIQKADIDSFLSASGKEPFGRRIVVDTSGAPWGKNAQDAIEGQQIPVSRVTLAYLRDSDIDWRTYSLGSTQAPKTRERKVPCDHQVRARSAVMRGFEEHDRGTMVMACGTGKTFTALTIAREFVEKEGGTARILFAVPSLALLKQTLDDWAAEADGAFTAWAVCSDTKVSSSARNDTAEESAVDLPIPATTDGQRLADSLNANNATEGLQVVFATYQSIEVIHRAQELAGDEWRDFDLVICDEAHRTTGATLTGEDESAFTKIHSGEFIRRAKTLYMTATPRIFADKTKNTASEKDVILTSMDDQETYGPVFFRLGFGQAVKENLLTDYKVIILTVSEEEVSGQYQAIAEMGGELNLDTAAKLTGCWNALAKRKNRDSDVDYGEDRAPMRRAVAFCKNIKASKAVATQFPDLVNGPHGLSDLSNDDASDNLQVECHHVDGTMNAAVRSREMDWLTEGAGTDEVPVCRILTNARCLSEGVDVPTLDAVLFLAPRKSQVDVIQAVGRVMRRAEGKDFGYIILPVAVPSGMSPEQALDDNKRFQVVWQVLKALRAHDERLDAAINSMELNGQGPENIIVEQVYHQVRAEQGVDEGYVEFPGMTLTDTFQLHEGDGTITEDFEGLAANNERAKAEKDSAITVIVMNPPYSVGQKRANDNNKNLAYPRLDERIATTYTRHSTASRKGSLYDSYLRALRWASDRIGERGVIGFVSNNSFIEGNSADGVRISLQEEFSQIFIFNLRGGTRGKVGIPSLREGGSIFDIQTGVAISILVRDPTHTGPVEIFYAESPDFATRQEKIDQIVHYQSMKHTGEDRSFKTIEPNQHGDWIDGRDDNFITFQEIGNKKYRNKRKRFTPAIFCQFSSGVKTCRDAWCYNFSFHAVASNMQRMIDNYNAEVDAGHTSKTATQESKLIAWGGDLPNDLDKAIRHKFDSNSIRIGLYRPFCTQYLYFSDSMNERIYQTPQLFPTSSQQNLSITVSTDYRKHFTPFITELLPDLNSVGTPQIFPLYTWEPLSPTSGSEPDLFAEIATTSGSQADEPATASSLDFSRPIGGQIPVILDSYRRVDNVTDATLASYREHYGDAGITKEDIFFYVYALLHHPEYRERYEDDLKKMLPHIPRAAGFHTYASVGRELADLHVNYERVEPYPSVQEEASLHAPADPWERYRIGERKMRFPKLGRRDKDFTRLEYNDYVTLTGIPAEAQGYSISGRSPLGWIIDRYHVKTDKASGIVNDPNDFLREQGRPDAVVDLIKRLVTVSMRTQELLATLPPLEIPEGE